MLQARENTAFKQCKETYVSEDFKGIARFSGAEV